MASRRVSVASGNHDFQGEINDFEGIIWTKLALARAKSLRGRLGRSHPGPHIPSASSADRLHTGRCKRCEPVGSGEPVGCVVFCALSLGERFHRLDETAAHGVELHPLLLVGALKLLQLVVVNLQAFLCSNQTISNRSLIRTVALHAR
eukprot:6227325-Prymnesium_polylepis.1